MKNVYFISIACILDAIATHVGIIGGFIEEGNPLMKVLLDKYVCGFYLVKIGLPLLLVGLCYYFKVRSSFVQFFLSVATVIYTYLLLYHMIWIGVIVIK